MKSKKTLILSSLLIPISLSIVSCNKEEKYYQVNYLNESIKLIGSNQVKENESYHFDLDYDDSYFNEALEVKVNDIVLPKTLEGYVIDKVTEDLNIEVNIIKKDSYLVTLKEDKKLYDIFTNEPTNNLEANQDYSFTLRFWGGIDLTNAKVYANNTLLTPNDGSSSYVQDKLYNFDLKNVNQDVTIHVEGADILTWYTYDFGDHKEFEHGVFAEKALDTSKIGYNFLGWSLEKDNKEKIVEMPYLNTTDKNEVTLYAIYEFDNKKLDLPYIQITTTSPLQKDNYSRVDIKLSEKKYTKKLSCLARIRGNSTAEYYKKPYKIKFDTDTSIFGSPKYKDWVLLADYLDPSLMRNYTAMSLSNYSKNMDFKHFLKHVELEIDGVYQGVFLLTDQVEENKHGRCEIKMDKLPEEQVPFLLERDKDGEGIRGVNYFSVGITNYIIKYPEFPTPKQFDYIYNYVNDIYTAITTNDLNFVKKHMDMYSFYDYALINELMVNIDSNWKSGYMYKSLKGPLMFGPVWDFDWCFTTWSSWPCVEQEFKLKDKYFLLKRDPKDFSFDWMIYLIQNESIYKELLKAWDNLQDPINKTLKDIENYRPYIEEAGLRNYKKWYEEDYKLGGKYQYVPKNDNLFFDQYDFLIDAFKIRHDALKQELSPSNHDAFKNEEFIIK